MDRTQKEAFVSDLHHRLSEVELVVVGHYSGLTVAEMTKLRQEMTKEGGEIQVAKNRLAKLAFKDTPCSVAGEFLTGPTALAMSKDPVAAAKVAQKFADGNENFIIVGGAMGEKKLSADEVKALSKMPSLDELRAKLAGLMVAPATKLATVTQAPASQLARVIAMKEQAKEAA